METMITNVGRKNVFYDVIGDGLPIVFVTPLLLCRPIADAIPNFHIRIIPATSHLTIRERPAEFNGAFAEFLAAI